MNRRFWVVLSTVLLLVAVAPMIAQREHAEGYEVLVTLNDEIRADAIPPVVEGLPSGSKRSPSFGVASPQSYRPAGQCPKK
jgi:hypothetical protein